MHTVLIYLVLQFYHWGTSTLVLSLSPVTEQTSYETSVGKWAVSALLAMLTCTTLTVSIMNYQSIMRETKKQCSHSCKTCFVKKWAPLLNTSKLEQKTTTSRRMNNTQFRSINLGVAPNNSIIIILTIIKIFESSVHKWRDEYKWTHNVDVHVSLEKTNTHTHTHIHTLLYTN